MTEDQNKINNAIETPYEEVGTSTEHQAQEEAPKTEETPKEGKKLNIGNRQYNFSLPFINANIKPLIVLTGSIFMFIALFILNSALLVISFCRGDILWIILSLIAIAVIIYTIAKDIARLIKEIVVINSYVLSETFLVIRYENKDVFEDNKEADK